MLKFWKRLIVIVLVIVGVVSIFRAAYDSWSGGENHTIVMKESILYRDLQGVILNGKRFLENLKDYREEAKIKAVFINVNSPGGAVGPSQEIYAEIKRTHE